MLVLWQRCLPRLFPWCHRGPPASPRLLVLLHALWWASVGNLPLWYQMSQMPELENLTGGYFLLSTGVLLSAGGVALLSSVAWAPAVRPALALLAVVASLGADGHGLLGGPLWRDLLLFAGPPCALLVWVTPTPARPWWTQAQHNAVMVACALGVIITTSILNVADHQWVLQHHPELLRAINPVQSLLTWWEGMRAWWS